MRASTVVDQVLRLKPDLPVIARELDDDDDTVVRKVAPGRAEFGAARRADPKPVALPEAERLSRQRLRRLVPVSRRAVEKLVRDGHDATLDRDEQLSVQAIVTVLARPAILVQDGHFFPASQPWTDVLEQHRVAIEAVFPRVGRVTVTGHPRLSWVGTAWLAAEQVLMTNRHVAAEFASNQGAQWSFMTGMSAGVDYREPWPVAPPGTWPIVEIVGVHETFDLALLRCDASSGPGFPATPLTIAAQPNLVAGTQVYVVGYPAADSRSDPVEMRQVFAGVYDVKRLQPGAVQSVSAGEVEHDCSTLGGNSGSCVVDLATSEVVGLHARGQYHVGNFAIALWELADDPLLRRAGVQIGAATSS